MISIKLFLTLVAISYPTYGLGVNSIYSEDLIGQAQEKTRHEDFGLNIVQFLQKYGYPIESHEVVTEDGYILTLHRIPHGRHEKNGLGVKKPVAFFMHGLMCSSMDWVNIGPNSSLALALADTGYDVWLGNNRGNTWSRKHVSLDPDTDKEFWDFSFEDCGNYDLPASIDYILNLTGNKKVNYIGHSQGTSQFLVMTTLRAEYNQKIALSTLLAPIGYMKGIAAEKPSLEWVSNYSLIFEATLNRMEKYELFRWSPSLSEVIADLCSDGSRFQEICTEFLSRIGGEDSQQLDSSFIQVIGSNAPAGISTKMLFHFMQMIKSGYFRRYDYGLKNIQIYRQRSPPLFDLSLISSPVALYYAKNDASIPIINAEILAERLRNVAKKQLVEYELFNHFDFLWAKDVKTLLYNDVIALINKHNSIS